MRYNVPINDPEIDADGEEGSQTIDIVTLEGTKKQKIKAWRRYLRVRLGTQDVHTMNRVTNALGFNELVP